MKTVNKIFNKYCTLVNKDYAEYIILDKRGFIKELEEFVSPSQGLPAESAEKILEDGINDGRYANILDVINVDTKTPFFKEVVQFAKDYASQFQSRKDIPLELQWQNNGVNDQ